MVLLRKDHVPGEMSMGYLHSPGTYTRSVSKGVREHVGIDLVSRDRIYISYPVSFCRVEYVFTLQVCK